MPKLYLLGLIVLATVLISFAWAEQITLSTYYPAPYGAFKELDIDYLDFKNDAYRETIPRNMPAHEEGRLCYDYGAKKFKYSDGSSWKVLGGGPGNVAVIDWFFVTTGSEYGPIPHGLGSTNLIIEIYFAPDDGTGNPDESKINRIDWVKWTSYDALLEITSSDLILHTSWFFVASTRRGNHSSGFYKIFLLKVD